jgi:Arc/MetJ family transcription regulator
MKNFAKTPDIYSETHFRYTGGVRKTTLDVDDELVDQAARILGTSGLKATVDRALHEVIAREARERLVEQLKAMDGLDLDKPDVLEQAWR